MKRPLDPRHHGLKEPEKVYTKTEYLYLADLNKEEKVTLDTLFLAWNKIQRELTSQGFRIKGSPEFNSDSYYGRGNRITYTYEWTNANYDAEMEQYTSAIAQFEQQFAAWKVFEEGRKAKLESGIHKNIDALIERAEHRLANLKAVKAGQPIPFPEG
jgi:hypothetical protein